MNERELVEKIKEHLGGTILMLDVGPEQTAISLHMLCNLALRGLEMPQKIQLPPPSPHAHVAPARQISDSPKKADPSLLQALLSDPRTHEVLKGMAHEIATQDVRATSHPMYCVRQAQYTRHLSGWLYAERVVWSDEDGNDAHGKLAEDLEETFRGTTRKHLDAVFDAETSDYLRIDGEPPLTDTEYTKTYYRYAVHTNFEVVAAFFTNKSAETYIEENRHNLRDPHVYVDSGYRNYEWQFVRALIVALGRTL